MDLAGTTEAGFKLTNLRQFASVAPENQANTTKPSSLPPSQLCVPPLSFLIWLCQEEQLLMLWGPWHS